MSATKQYVIVKGTRESYRYLESFYYKGPTNASVAYWVKDPKDAKYLDEEEAKALQKQLVSLNNKERKTKWPTFKVIKLSKQE